MREASQASRAVDEYGDMVRRICLLCLKSHSDAEDVFQEVFLKYILYPGVFESPEHEKAWLLRVAVNRCKDSLRSFFRSHTTPLEDIITAEPALPPEYGEIYDAVLSLPKNYRAVVYLFYYEGYTAVEIGKILGKNQNTIYTWLSRAKKLLRERLGGDDFA